MADRALFTCCCASNKRGLAVAVRDFKGFAPQPGARRFEVRTRASHQLPELRRVVHPLQVHQLVDHHVVADRVRHLHEAPVQADAALPRARAPPPALVADADARDLEAVPGGELEEPRRQLALRAVAELAFDFGRSAARRRGRRRSRSRRRRCFSIHALSRSANAAASRFEPQRGMVTRTLPSSATRSGSASREDDARRRSQVQMAATVV